MKFDIPVNFEVNADSEKEAEAYLQRFLKDSWRMFGQENGVDDFEFIDFVEAANSTGLGDNNVPEGEPVCCQKQGCDTSHSGCC